MSEEVKEKKTTKKVEEKEVKTAKKPVEKTVKAEKVEKPAKVEKTVKTEKVAKEEKVEKPAKAEKVVKEEKVEKPAAKKPAKAKTVKAKEQRFQGTGRRKESVARVKITAGTGKIEVNGKDLKSYFDLDTLVYIAKQPLVLTETEINVDIVANIYGGGKTGQAGALRHGIARALIEFRPELRAELKKAGFLTRDSRKKERKKYGLKKARRAPQFSKR